MSDHSHGSHGGGHHGGGEEANPLAVISISLCGGVILAFISALVGSAISGQRHKPAGEFEGDTGWAIVCGLAGIGLAILFTKQYEVWVKVVAAAVTLLGFVVAYAVLT